MTAREGKLEVKYPNERDDRRDREEENTNGKYCRIKKDVDGKEVTPQNKKGEQKGKSRRGKTTPEKRD